MSPLGDALAVPLVRHLHPLNGRHGSVRRRRSSEEAGTGEEESRRLEEEAGTGEEENQSLEESRYRRENVPQEEGLCRSEEASC